MILNIVACLGAKNSNVASDRCQVEFVLYCALLHSRFMFLQVFFCILYSSIFCILYSSVLWQRQRGFGSMWSWIWKQPQQIVGTATGVVWLDNFSAHCSQIWKIQTHTNTNTKFTQRVTNTKKGEFKGRCKVQKLHFSVWLSLNCIVYIIHICSLSHHSWQSVVLTSSNSNDRVALSCRV